MSEDPGSAEADPSEILSAFDRRSRRFETPCGEGSLVWRAWGSGPPVLLAHGSHGAWSHWIRNIDALAAERTVWAVDLLGYGESALPPSETHASIADVIVQGLRRLLPSDLPVDIVGFSFGGVAAAYMAALHPGIVRRLILVGTGGLDTPRGEVNLRGMRGVDESERDAVNRANLASFMLHAPESVDALAVHIHAGNGMRGRLNAADLVLPDKLKIVLPRVDVQVDAIWGAYDRPHPDPLLQADVLRLSHPDLDFRVIPDAGHWCMYERPAAFNAVLLDLLRTPLRSR